MCILFFSKGLCKKISDLLAEIHTKDVVHPNKRRERFGIRIYIQMKSNLLIFFVWVFSFTPSKKKSLHACEHFLFLFTFLEEAGNNLRLRWLWCRPTLVHLTGWFGSHLVDLGKDFFFFWTKGITSNLLNTRDITIILKMILDRNNLMCFVSNSKRNRFICRVPGRHTSCRYAIYVRPLNLFFKKKKKTFQHELQFIWPFVSEIFFFFQGKKKSVKMRSFCTSVLPNLHLNPGRSHLPVNETVVLPVLGPAMGSKVSTVGCTPSFFFF